MAENVAILDMVYERTSSWSHFLCVCVQPMVSRNGAPAPAPSQRPVTVFSAQREQGGSNSKCLHF